MTINSVEIIKTMLRNNGTYDGDPQPYSIYQYTTEWGNEVYYVSMTENDELALHLSPYVHNEKLLWSRTEGLTQLGRELI